MTIKYTKEQLNKFDKDLLIELFLGMQGQMEELSRQTQALNDRMQLMMEQMILFQKNRFGRSSEKMADSEQIRFMEVDGTIVFFNEAEAVCDLDAPEPEDLELKDCFNIKRNRDKTVDDNRHNRYRQRACDKPQKRGFFVLSAVVYERRRQHETNAQQNIRRFTHEKR